MTARDEWRWTDERGVQRLVGAEELRTALSNGVLPSSTLVWREGMDDWAPAASMPEFVGVGRTSAEGKTSTRGAPTPDNQPFLPVKPSAGSRHPTLVGLPSPDTSARAQQGITVPSADGAERKRPVITQVPRFDGPPTQVTLIPRASRTPGGVGAPEEQKPPPKRKPSTSEIDLLWSGAPSEEDETLPRKPRPGQLSSSHIEARVEQLADPPSAEPTNGASAGSATPPAEDAQTSKPSGMQNAERVIIRPPGPGAKPQGSGMSTPVLVARKSPAGPSERPPAKPPPLPPKRVSTKSDGSAAQPVPARTDAEQPAQPHARTSAQPRTPPPRPPHPAERPLVTTLLGVPPASPPIEAQGTDAKFEAPKVDAPKPAQADGGAPRAAAPANGSADPQAAQLVSPAARSEPPRAAIPSRPPPTFGPEPVRAGLSSHPPPALDAGTAHPAPIPSQPPPAMDPAATRASQRPPGFVSEPPPSMPPPPGLAPGLPVAVPVSSLYGAGGALIGMVIAAFFAGRCSAVPPNAITARPSLALVPALARAALPTPPKPCWVVRQPLMWAPKVSRSVPFEATATKSGTLAVGYARDSKEAVGMEVNLSTGEINERLAKKVEKEILRVAPIEATDLEIATAEAAGPLKSPIQIAGSPAFTVGVAAGGLATINRPDAEPAQLWPLEGDEGVEAVSAIAAGARGFAFTFRRQRAIWSGIIGPDRKAIGALVKVVGSGGAVGKPSSGWNQKELAVIFADRPEGASSWEIRVGRAAGGAVPDATQVFPLPRGGPGGDAFAPDIAGLPDGRWLMMWTEGAAGSRAVRAQTLDAQFKPLGDPIALSPPAGNFGQGLIGVAGGYAATIFLSKEDSKKGSSYELWGAILQCGG